MKTIFALVLYSVAIIILVASAVVIVVKLIFWPPCTQIGSTCVIDPWSTAGLAGTVLAVAATVLAILGAVSVAAWWTSLNATVTGRVKKLNKKLQQEVKTQMDALLKDQRDASNIRIDTLLAEQEKKVKVQLADFHDTLIALRNEMRHAQSLSERVNEIVKQSFSRSEQQAVQIRQADRQASDVLAHMQSQLVEAQQREGELERISMKYKDYLKERSALEDAFREKFESSGITADDLKEYLIEMLMTRSTLDAEEAKQTPKPDNANGTPT